jgi:hypothetical protein
MTSPEASKSTDGDRLERAMGVAGLSTGQLTRLCVERGDAAQRAIPVQAIHLRRRIERILCGDAAWGEPAFVLLVAELLDCDPRWLASGQVSRAARTAIDAVSRAATSLARRTDVLRQCCEVLELAVEPAHAVGLCRYCGCTVGCSWVDEAHTICSACLDPEAAQ